MSAMAGDNAASLAHRGVDDLLQHFWTGDETTGHIVNTWHGYPDKLPDPRGVLWERAMVFFALENAGHAFRDPSYAQHLRADWRHTVSAFTAEQLESCGLRSRNPASDDAGWSALMYLAAYRVTGDRAALDRARGLISHSFDRWLDDQLGGGLWYSDKRASKSLYQTALVLAALNVWQITGEPAFHDRALSCYDWMEAHLLRPDGLYWCGYGRDGPVGANRPDSIHEGGSVVFLGGNMAMAVLHARLHRITGEDKFRLRALRTADALAAHLTTSKGIYLNDRDA
jgi:predicted alpha-1,6-mannanase (GH76 family)